MAAGRETISLSFQAELGDLKRQLSTLPGVTKKQAAQMVRELNTGFKQAERAAAKAARANKRQFRQMADQAQLAGAAIAGTAASVIALSQAFADLQNELADASARTGVAVETLAGLRLAAEGSGLEFRALEAGLNKLPKSMADAARGTGAAAGAFETLGVQVEDASGALRSSDAVLQETFEALAAIESPAEKAALAIDLLGQRAGPAFIQSGAIDNLDAFVSLATEFGVDVGPKAAASAAEFQRQMAALKTVSQGALFDFVDSLGGPGGVNAVLEQSITAVIVFGRIAESVFETLRTQVGNLTGPLAEVAFELSEGDVAGAFKALQRNQDELIDGALGTNAMVLGYRLVTNAVEDAGEAAEEARRALALLNRTVEGGAPRGPGGATDTGAAAPSAASSAAQAVDPRLQALDRLRTAQQAAAEQRLGELERIELAYRRQVEVIREAQAAGAEAAEVDKSLADAQLERMLATQALGQQMHDERLEQIRREAEEQRRALQITLNASADAAGAIGDVFAIASAAFAEGSTEASQKAAKALFVAAQTAAGASIGLRVAEGLMVAATLPPPADGIKRAAVIAQGVASTAAIASAQPPTFDRGGIVMGGTGDQVSARVLPGEAVLNRTATRALGSRMIDEMNTNDGRSMMSAPRVVNVWKGRVYDDFVTDTREARFSPDYGG